MEAEIKFRLRRTELHFSMVYIKNIQKVRNIKGTKTTCISAPEELTTHPHGAVSPASGYGAVRAPHVHYPFHPHKHPTKQVNAPFSDETAQ